MMLDNAAAGTTGVHTAVAVDCTHGPGATLPTDHIAAQYPPIQYEHWHDATL